jgi:uncharacterized protein YjbI with pentapeptide repeats
MAEAGETRQGEQRCGVRLGLLLEGPPCGRPIYAAPEHGETPVCLMHSQDPGKDAKAFEQEFERILAEAEGRAAVANFRGFVFPSSDFRGKEFRAGCNFVLATFTRDADFSSATFTQRVDFADAQFHSHAGFVGVKFMRNAVLSWATFTRGADFAFTKFMWNATFERARFMQDADFSDASFTQVAGFNDAMFAQDVTFSSAMFTKAAYFRSATFTRDAVFESAMFTLGAYFKKATFAQGADFSGTRFAKNAVFSRARFSEAPIFRATKFRHDLSCSVGLDFSNVMLAHPEKVEFYDVDLGQAVFFNTDVSKVDFALARWRERGRIARYLQRKRWLRWRLGMGGRPTWAQKKSLLKDCRRGAPGRYCLFEEETHFDDDSHPLGAPLSGGDARNYALIAETYQQLKRNYDTKGDYWTAGHFHYGEMEMLRLHSEWNWALLRWLERNLGLTALYKYASAYGESLTRPLLWLAVFVLGVFPLLYPAMGLEVNASAQDRGLAGWRVDYWNANKYFSQHPEEIHMADWVGRATGHCAAAPLLMHSAMASISVAGFQKELRYAPSYPWGRALALLELLLTTTVGGLFLLAVRRQYKRS